MVLQKPQQIEYNVPYIREILFNLSREYCNELIEKFENSNEKYQGTVGENLVDTKIKDSMDLAVVGPEWQGDVQYLSSKLFDATDGWAREHHRMVNVTFPNGKVSYSGFQIQKTLPGTIGYVWHSDEAYHWNTDSDKNNPVPMRRYITYLWYLNDNDGYTEFQDRRIKPEAGKLLLFFADPSFIHRGIAPTKGPKYIMTGWISTEIILQRVY